MRLPLEALGALVSPPDRPIGLDLSWKTVERELGLTLPADYKAFINVYGSGTLTSPDGWVAISNFRDSGKLGKSFQESLCGENSLVAQHNRQETESDCPCPYPVYPTAGGLLPFATVLDVNNLNWLTTGDPEKWDVVHWSFDLPVYTRLNSDTFSRCLLKMLRGQYKGLKQPASMKPPFQFKQ
ncbi:MAG TPA: SMI1/KNR4 family protein [Schlesneria sp.]